MKNSAQLMYEAFALTARTVQINGRWSMFEKNKFFYIGNNEDFFVSGMNESEAVEMFLDKIIEDLVHLAHNNPECLEEEILKYKLMNQEIVNDNYH